MFPATITLHNPAQLNAVLRALQDLVPLTAADFKDPAVGAAYAEAAARVAAHDAQPAPAAAPAESEAASFEGKPPAPAASPARSRRTAAAALSTSAPPADAPAPSISAPAPPPATAPAASASSASPSADPVTYAAVAAAITAAVKQDRQWVVGVLADFGATKGPDLKPEQYAAFLQALQRTTEPA